MSYCKEDGKDKIIFVTESDHKTPSTIVLNDDVETEPGLIKDNGEINWNCPCLGGMATGPCGYEFRQAFSCFHTSKADQKGSDCYEEFRGMQECMTKYPTLYESEKDSNETNGEDELTSFDSQQTDSETGLKDTTTAK